MAHIRFMRELYDWKDAICREGSPYCESDTIEHIVVPILQEMGFSTDDSAQVRFVRGNRNNKGDSQAWDLTVCDGDYKQPTVVIETKAANFDLRKGMEGDEGSKEWTPHFKNNVFFQLMRKFAGYEVSAIKCKRKTIDRTTIEAGEDDFKKFLEDQSVSRELLSTDSPVSIDLCKETLKKVFADHLCEKVDWGALGDDVCSKYLIVRALMKNGNPSEDYFGQVWRYCCDMKHNFKRGHTVPILTNGCEWFVFTNAFYDIAQRPKVVWKRTQFLASDFYKYVKISSITDIENLYEVIKEQRRMLDELSK